MSMRSIAILGVLAAVATAGPGEDLARAQKKGDIVTVQRLVDDMEDARWTSGSLHELMLQLDAKRSGAFVSAPCLARHLLLAATASGDMKSVPDAAKVAIAHAKQRGAGRCAKAMALYADGMLARLKEDDANAATSFQKAFAIARDEGSTPIAMHLAVESAALKLRLRDSDGAAAAIDALAKLYPAGSDASLAPMLGGQRPAR